VLTVGQKTVVSTAPQATAPVVETVSPTVVDQTLAWQTSRFIFDNMPLSEVVERFNHSGAKTLLVVDDPRLATMKFSGRARAASIDSFVEVLESNFGVAAERREDGRIVLRKAR
jgi:transmembrane sensor